MKWESEHLSGENRMFSAVHSDKRMARVTGTLYMWFNAAFRLGTPKIARTKQERRNLDVNVSVRVAQDWHSHHSACLREIFA